MSRVGLSRGIQGWFIPWLCGANCNDAKVVWEEHIYRYSMGIKLGDRASLVKMANSAIEAGDLRKFGKASSCSAAVFSGYGERFLLKR